VQIVTLTFTFTFHTLHKPPYFVFNYKKLRCCFLFL
jgi:hypothetical protein